MPFTFSLSLCVSPCSVRPFIQPLNYSVLSAQEAISDTPQLKKSLERSECSAEVVHCRKSLTIKDRWPLLGPSGIDIFFFYGETAGDLTILRVLYKLLNWYESSFLGKKP